MPTPLPGIAGDSALAALAERARVIYENAQRAQREGDWAQYGEEMKRLGEVLDEMRESGNR